jgi:adenylate cyclase
MQSYGGFRIWGGDLMAEEGFKRKLTAILSADVAGYSRLMSEDESATVKTLETYREVMSTLIIQHRGRVIDSPGDNLLAEFTSVVDAVQCAVAVQKEFQARNAQLPENRRMEFRIGVNLGDVIEEGERIYGDGVNIAARLEALADPGGICISKTAFDQIETKLPLGYEFLGEQDVKNIPKPVGAYRVLMEPRVTVAEEIEKVKTVPLWQRKTILAASVVLILVVIAALIWNFYLRPPPMEVASVERMALPLPDKPSIAVLAFTNMSGDPDQEYFSDGLTEEIITTLSKVSDLFVIARQSTFSYKGKPVKIRQVAEELGVRYVLEGSVRKGEDRVRITAQLIDALTGRHLWAEAYDRELKDILAVQGEITKEIITALEVKLTMGEQARLFAKGTDNVEAWALGIKAWKIFSKYSKENNAKAQELLERATKLDPDYPFLWMALAFTHFVDARLAWTKSQAESLKRALEFTEKTLSLDPENPVAHGLMGNIYLFQRQYEKAIGEGQRAVSLGPNYADGYAMLSQIMRYSGRFEEALELIKKAMRLGPIHRAFYTVTLAAAYLRLERYDEAIPVSKQLTERWRRGECPPTWGYTTLISAYMGLGKEEEARAVAEKLLAVSPTYSLELHRKKNPYKDPAHLERIVSALRKAGIPDKPPLPLPDKPSIAVLPFTNLSDDPKQEYFVDGMTDDLITDLSKISGLFVIARNSVFRYKGKPVDVKKVSRELGVKHVLEGSVRKVGKQVRINAQLIDASTGGYLWAERYDGKMDNVFALQDEITGKIVTALAVKLTAGEQVQVARKGSDNIAAYDAYLKGWRHYLQRTPDDFAKAISYFEKAIELDSNYRRAYAALAKAYWSASEVGFRFQKAMQVSWREARVRARDYLRMAIKNPTSITHTLFSEMNLSQRLHEQSIAEAKRAIELDPNDSDSHLVMAKALIFAGRQEEALDFVKNAMRLDPHNIAHPLYLRGLAHFAMGQLDETVVSIERALTHNPEISGGAGALAVGYALLGRDQEAQAALDQYFKRYDKTYRGSKHLSQEMYYWPFKDPEAAERFADGLLKAGVPGQPSGYYKISEEHRLGGKDIRSLFFGRTVTSWPRHTELGKDHFEDRTKKGKATWRAAPDDPWGQDGSGTSWIEGDMLCNQWQIQIFGIKHCMTVFRNPEGTPETKDEYLAVSDFGIFRCSPVD